MAFADSQANAVIYSGTSPAPILLAGTVSRGDAVGYSAGWKRALATTGSVVQIRCVAAEDGLSGQTIIGYFDNTVVGGSRFSGATKGGALYVAESTDSGKYTQTAPSTSGDSNKIVGYAISETMMLVMPNANVDATA